MMSLPDLGRRVDPVDPVERRDFKGKVVRVLGCSGGHDPR